MENPNFENAKPKKSVPESRIGKLTESDLSVSEMAGAIEANPEFLDEINELERKPVSKKTRN